MSKINEVFYILKELGFRENQFSSYLCARVLLALTGLKETDPWSNVRDRYIGIHDIAKFISENYDFTYAENSRESIRKNAIKPFIIAGVAEKNLVATNSGKTAYRLTSEASYLLSQYRTDNWDPCLAEFKQQHESLSSIYAQKRNVTRIPIEMDGFHYDLSANSHNRLQAAVINDFAPIFAQGTQLLYMGDSTNRYLFQKNDLLQELRLSIDAQSYLPDIVLYQPEKKWIYFIEVVTSVGCIDAIRKRNLEEMAKDSGCDFVFVTAFLNKKAYVKHINDLAWETEIWIADNPDHMIHLNGDKFLGPH